MFTLEEKDLIAEKLREHQNSLRLTLNKTPAADWLRCHVAWVESLIKKVCHTNVLQMRLCETEHLILKAGTLYRFTVDQTCDRCKELDRIGNPG